MSPRRVGLSLCKRLALKSVLSVGMDVIANRRMIRQVQRGRLRRVGARPRRQVTVEEVYAQLGPVLFQRAYRMEYRSFKKLWRLLDTTSRS